MSHVHTQLDSRQTGHAVIPSLQSVVVDESLEARHATKKSDEMYWNWADTVDLDKATDDFYFGHLPYFLTILIT